MTRSKAGTKKISLDGQSLPNQNTIIINILWKYYIKYFKNTMKFNKQNIK